MDRKHISWKTRYASAMLMLYPDMYEHAKLMGESNFASLFQDDHNILHETNHPSRDEFWNLTQRFIAEHREKTRQDLKIIAKGRRIRQQNHYLIINREMREYACENPERALAEAFMQGKFAGQDQANKLWKDEANRPGGAVRWARPPRKIRSRGFDKTLKRKMDGTVVRK